LSKTFGINITFVKQFSIMRKSTIIKKIIGEVVKVSNNNQMSSISVEDDLKTTLLYTSNKDMVEKITHIFSDSVSTATFIGDDEVDWNDIDLKDLNVDILSEILMLLEDHSYDKMMDTIKSYDY